MKYFSILLLSVLVLSGCATSYTSAPNSKTCDYNNLTYSNGETFPAGDSCNECSCEDGQVECTEKACDTDILDKNPAMCETSADCERLNLDSSFCTSGEWTCEYFECQFSCDISGLVE